MDWTQVLTILGVNASLFLWSVRLSRTDYLHLDKKLDENRRETNAIIKTIQEEMKEFHERLYSLEERSRERK